MPRIEASVTIPVTPEVAFAVSASQGEVRYRWDRFVKEQNLINADKPGKGVQTLTKSRHGLKMVSEYTSFKPPNLAGMKMVSGPPIFSSFGGGWSFRDGEEPGTTLATWRYTFTIRPKWLAIIGDPIGSWYLRRDIRRRLDGFAEGCVDPWVVERLDLD